MSLAPRHRFWLPYLIASGEVALATLVRYALTPYVGTRMPYVVFYFAMIPIASRLGTGPALAGLALSTVAAVFCFVEPARDWGLATLTDVIGLILFVLVNLTLIEFAETSRVAHSRLEREVAERVRAEAAIRLAKQAADDANQAKDRFIAVLSHELRTPLNPVALTVQALLDRPDQPDEVRSDLESIRHYVGLETRLIDDLLDVMRIARGQFALHWEVVDLHALIVEVARGQGPELAARGLRLITDLAAGHHYVQGDPHRLRQVVANLLRNATTFTPSGGSVTIRSRNDLAPNVPAEGRRVVSFVPETSQATTSPPATSADLAPNGRGDGIVIEVEDTGIGIDPEALALIFEPFQQADPTINRQFGGLGLGLAICSGIIGGHGGTLHARSVGRNQGSTFTACLRTVPSPNLVPEDEPAGTTHRAASRSSALPDNSTRPPRSVPELAGLPLRVLVVEDEPATVRVMARLLRGLGYQVTTAATVAEATGWVDDGTTLIDLLVSDIGLPDGSGLDLIRRARASRPTLPAIALTGFGTEADIEQSRLAGFAAHMTKPIDFNQLATLIRQVAPTRV